jgi:FixJ family two-component response regulator
MVFIVDDDQNVRDGFMMLLQSAGFKSSAYESAEKFLDYYEQHHNHDLLILDISLGGMSGCDLMEYLTKRKLHLPVIIITAFDREATRKAAKDYGALAYLRKPVDSSALIDLIKFNVSNNYS